MLSQGWRDRDGRKFAGLEEMTERLRKQRRKQLEKYSLDNVFKDIEEKLDNVVRLERQGIDERLRKATTSARKRILERVASKRREQLDNLPANRAGPSASSGLRVHGPACRAGLPEAPRGDQAGRRQHLLQADDRADGPMSQQDVAALREMARDLNALVRQKLEGVPEAQLQHNYEDFLEKWGAMFPDAPATFDEFLAQLAAQMARMDSLMQSLSPEMRHQLEEIVAAAFGDPELQAQLAELMGGLEMLSDAAGSVSATPSSATSSCPLDQAMSVMDRLQSIEELERGLRGMYRGEPLDSATEEALRDVLGDNAARDLSRLQRMADQLEHAASSNATTKALRLTARGTAPDRPEGAR